MTETSEILGSLSDLVFNNKSRLESVIHDVIKRMTDLFGLKWTALYIRPLFENFILPEKVFLSHSRLRPFFSMNGNAWKKTLLFRMKKSPSLKSGEYRISGNYPEYSPSVRFFAHRFSSPSFLMLLEYATGERNIPDEKSFLNCMRFIRDGISSRLREINHQNKLNELISLIEISRILNSTMDLETLLDKLFSEVKRIMRTEGCSLMLIDKNTGELRFKTVKGKKSRKIKEYTIPAGKGIAGWIVATGRANIVNDVKKDRRFYRGMDLQTGFKTRNIIGAPLISQDQVIGIIEAVNRQNHGSFSEPDKELLTALANQAAIAIKNAENYKDLQDLFYNVVTSLSAAIDAKDKYTIGHSERVTRYSLALARYLKMDPEFIRLVELAGLLHDIGKIGIDEKILTKPARLTEEEYEQIKKHPVIGEGIIRPITALREILPGIRHHHERWDGRGYPDGLQGNNIPMLGRIMALADSYDAMTSHRPYRKCLSLKQAIEEIQRCAGTQFDPELASAFVEMIRKNK